MIGAIGTHALTDGLAALALARPPRRSAAAPAAAAPAGDRHRAPAGPDEVDLSPAARAATDRPRPAASAAGRSATPDGAPLTAEERETVEALARTDRAVRAHEQAHQSAAGGLGGAASYGYTTGPDGRRYATSGEVPIDVSPVEGDPAATVRKMQQVRRAALAPAQPSAADRAVAAQAARQEREARGEAAETAREPQGDDGRAAASPAPASLRRAATDAYAAFGADAAAPSGPALDLLA